MTKTPQPLPSGGGSYTRDAKGGLVQAEAPTREEGQQAPAKSDVKEG